MISCMTYSGNIRPDPVIWDIISVVEIVSVGSTNVSLKWCNMSFIMSRIKVQSELIEA